MIDHRMDDDSPAAAHLLQSSGKSFYISNIGDDFYRDLVLWELHEQGFQDAVGRKPFSPGEYINEQIDIVVQIINHSY
jgi:hypothetical protein